MNNISFEYLSAFALLPLPLLLIFFKQRVSQQSVSIFFPLRAEQLQTQSTGIKSSEKNWLKIIILFVAWCLLVCSIARPIHLGDAIEIPQTGRDVFLAVDLSGSMREQDMQLNNRQVDRLTLVKHVLDDFIAQRQGDRLGLILFGTQAFIQAPLTFDLTTLQTLLNESQIGFAGNKTAIGDAIGLGIKRLSEHDNDDKVLILLTDGTNTAGSVDPIQASEIAKQEGVVIYTIAIGAEQAQRRGLFGMSSYNPSGDLDTKTLSNIAKITGGEFFRATNQTDLKAIYQAIDAREAIDQDAQVFRPKQDWFYYPLAAFLFLCALLFSLELSQGIMRGQH